MQNIDVRFNASSNFAKVRADMAALTAQSEALNASFAKGAYASAGAVVDPAAWRNGTSAVSAASRAYREAASSSGLLETQQIRSTSEAEKYTRALQKQKLSLTDMIRHQGIMKEVYRDQLRQQRMTAQYWGTDSAGKHVTDITMPKNVPTELDTWRRKMGMFGNMAASAGTQVINLGKNMQWSGRQLMAGFTYPMAMFGAAAGVTAFKVEDAFAKINKVYDLNEESLNNSAAREKELGQLREDSLKTAAKAAEQYGSRIEAVLAVEQELAATGLKGQGLMDATDQVMRISALGDIDPSSTTQMVVSLQTAFKDTIKDTDDLNNALNFMNAASNASSLSLADIAEATPRAATSIAQLGGTVEDMTTILVSMREAGVPATEAANAIKSAGTRIINPVPKAIDYYASLGKNIKGAAINIEELSQKSGGNLIEFLRMLGEEQQRIVGYDKKTGEVSEKETARLKAKGVATLFGTYQNNRLTASLVNLTDAYSGVENQTKKVMDLEKETNAELQKRADLSLAQMVDNLAGDFKKAWASFEGELAEIGKPFLKAATKILEVFTMIAKGFNSLSEGKKNAIMMVALFAALAGPAIMLTGLFMNLFGQMVKGTGTLMKLVGVSRLFTKEETAAALTTQAVNKAMMTQQSTASTLAAEINVLTASYERAAVAANAFLTTTSRRPAPTQVPGTVAPTAPQPQPATWTPSTPQQQFLGMPGGLAAPRMQDPMNQTARSYAYAAERAEILARAERQRLNDNVANTRQTLRQQGAYNNMNQSVNGMNTGLAIGGAAMATMMLTSGAAEGSWQAMAGSAAKWVLIATLVVPAVKAVAAGTIVAARAGAAYATSAVIAARANAAGAVGLGRIAGTMRVAGAGMAGMAAGVARTIGPAGVIVAGAIALGAVYKWAWDKGREAREEQARMYREQQAAQEAISNSTKKWLESMGKVAGKYEAIYHYSGVLGEDEKALSEQEQLIKYYQTNPEGEGEAPIKAYEDLDRDSSEYRLTMLQKFIDLQVEGQMSAEAASAHMRAMFIAMGESAHDADMEASRLIDTWGSVDANNFDWSGFFDQQMTLFNEADPAEAAERGKDVAEAFSAGLANAKDPKVAKAMLDSYVDGPTKAIAEAWTNLGNTYGREFYSAMEDRGVRNVREFAELLRSTSMEELRNMEWTNTEKTTPTEVLSLDGGPAEIVQRPDGYSLPWGEIEAQIAGANAQQDHLLSGLDAIMHFGDDVPSIFSLPEYSDIEAVTLSYKEQKKIVEGMQGPVFMQRSGMDETMMGMTRINGSLDLAAVNAFNFANGLKQSDDPAEAVYNFLNKVPAVVADADGKARGLKNTLNSIDKNMTITIKANQIGGIIQSGIEGVRDDMINDANRIFDAGQESESNAFAAAQEAASNALSDRQEAASRAMSDRQEAASRAMQERQEAAMRAFENRWEKRKETVTKLYDDRIKAIQNTIDAEQKADEVRQRLFEKEKARLAELAEDANTQIDFDVAINTGNLDEAAKIQNNAGADNQNDQMDKETKQAEERTQRLIERLDKKRERLEKMRDKALKRLEKVEERMRRSLEKMQEAQQRALENQQEAQQRALERTQQAQSNALEDRQRAEEQAQQERMRLAQEEHDNQLELFKALPAASKAQLLKALRAAGLELKDFGIETLEPRADAWGQYFENGLTRHMRIAGAEIAKDNMWEDVANNIALDMLKGFGFASRGAFEKFVKTGKLPEKKPDEARHEGGVVGSGKGSMGNLANRKTLSPSEKMIRAQVGEYVVNKNSSKKYHEVLERINSGNVPFTSDGIGAYTSLGGGVNRGFAPFGEGIAMAYSGLKHGMSGAIANNLRAAREAERQRAKAAQANGGRGGGVYIPGDGGRSRPTTPAPLSQGIHAGDGYRAVDIATPIGQPVYAVEDGRVTASYDIPGYESRRMIMGMTGPAVQDGMRSYGRVINFRGDSGDDYVYAHLSKRAVAAGTKKIPGGSVIGYSGNAGNVQSSSGNGAHLHWGPRAGDPYAFLRNGGEIKYDNTTVKAHAGESILTKRLTTKFKESVSSGGGGGDTYEVTLDLRGAMIKEELDIEKAVYAAIDKKNAKVGRKRTVN